jgi:hypothetical protein
MVKRSRKDAFGGDEDVPMHKPPVKRRPEER